MLRRKAVVEGQVSFEVLSETVTAAAVTQRLGLLPTSAVERGELVGNGRTGRRADAAYVKGDVIRGVDAVRRLAR